MPNNPPPITTTSWGQKRLWPESALWQTADLLRTERYADHTIGVYHVSTDNGHHYAFAAAWPDVWHKTSPVFGEAFLIKGRVAPATVDVRSRHAVQALRVTIDRHARGENILADGIDLIFDARDPKPKGRSN